MPSASILSTVAMATLALAAQRPSWKVGAKWQLEIQDPVKIPDDPATPMSPDADVWDIDLWHAYKNPDVVKGLHDRGKTVICYYNFGAVQPQDCDFNRWIEQGFWTGKWYADVNEGQLYCEKYADFTNQTIFDKLLYRVDMAAEAGCDGIDPDNIDIWELPNVPESQKEKKKIEVIKAMTDLKKYAKTKNIMVGQKNAPAIAEALAGILDFAVLEECIGGGFCEDFESTYGDKGLPIVDIEYPASLINKTDDEGSGCNLKGIDNCARGIKPAPGEKACKPKVKPVCKNKANAVSDKISEILKLNLDKHGLNACTQYCNDGAAFLLPVVPENTEGDDETKWNACNYKFKSCGGRCSPESVKDKYCCTAEEQKNQCCKCKPERPTLLAN